MNTRHVAEEYRLTHWAQIMQDRQESGLSIKAYCENAGFRANIYYYWQRKLREAACGEALEGREPATSMAPIAFAEVKLAEQPVLPISSAAYQSQLRIDVAGVLISADSEYPNDKLAALIRELRLPC